MPRLTSRSRVLVRALTTTTIAALVIGAVVTVTGAPSHPTAVAASCAPSSDFDGDGIEDLAVGIPGESVGSSAGAGAVAIIFGSNEGVFDRDLLFTQSSPGVSGAAEVGDRFGSALVSGDFNNDGFADLAVGVPGEDAGAGAVQVLYGSASGPSAEATLPDLFLTQSSGSIPGGPESDDRFGEALAVGDIDNDGFDDLLIGVPGEDLPGATDAGVVDIVFGSSAGVNPSDVDELKQGVNGLAGSPEVDDRFGRALAACDFDGGGFDDIAVGIAEGIGSRADAGAVQVVLGSSSGPRATGSMWLQQGGDRIGSAESGDDFGAALAAGDVDADGLADLAVGVPGEAVGSDEDQGMVQIFRSAGGTLAADTAWHQDVAGIPGAGAADEEMGTAVAMGDFDRDGFDDVAVGAPKDGGAGSVLAIYGSTTGPSIVRAALFTQDTPGVPGTFESGDRWGSALAARDVDGDGIADLAIGAWSEDGSGPPNDGGLNVLFGARGPSTGGPGLLIGQDSTGIQGSAASNDNFGYAIA